MQAKELAKIIIKALDEKKAEDIRLIDVSTLTQLGDYFIIANGTSNTHVRALSEEALLAAEKHGVEPRGVEGRSTGWVLLDFSDVLVNIFTQADRDYYSLERLWKDGEFIDIAQLLE